MTAVHTELDLSVLVDFDAAVPCSGFYHKAEYIRSGARWHDNTQDASYLIRSVCPGCGKSETRPVCEFYKNVVEMSGRRHIIHCSIVTCQFVGFMADFTTVLGKL